MTATSEVSLTSLDTLASRLPAPGAVDVTIEIVGEEIGDQIQVRRLPWHALVYDSSGDVLELSVGARGQSVPVVFRHEIHNPLRVWVEDDGGSVTAISIEQAGGLQTIVRFFERSALEPGS